jgi:hypothetical protein
MPERAALVIAVETFFEVGPPVPYAAADAAELLRALPAAGYNPQKCLLLAGHRTTRAVIESHLARLAKLLGKPESLLVLFITRAFAHRGHGYLACADTMHADLPGTSIAVADLLAAIHKMQCKDAAILLDVDPLPIAGELAPGGLNEAELKKLLDNSPCCTALVAASPGERSFESAPLRRGIWRHHLLEAFTGKIRSGAAKDGTLTAAALQGILADAVPRTVLRSYESQQQQTPLLFGESNAGMIVAELAGVLGSSGDALDPARMRRVVFRSETVRKIKDFAGFRKSHSLPERANEWARKFVNRIAQPDIKADLDETFDMVREQFSYKRKDIDVSSERDGVGFLRTPDFEFTVTVEVNPEAPTEAIWRREVSRLADPEFVRSEAFVAVFGSSFDKLVFEFTEPLDVAQFVDRIEEQPAAGVKVNVASGSDAAEVKLAGFTGRISVTRDAVMIEGRSGATVGLLDQFLIFLSKFRGLGEAKALLE